MKTAKWHWCKNRSDTYNVVLITLECLLIKLTFIENSIFLSGQSKTLSRNYIVKNVEKPWENMLKKLHDATMSYSWFKFKKWTEAAPKHF